jgi:hypothetical protein
VPGVEGSHVSVLDRRGTESILCDGESPTTTREAVGPEDNMAFFLLANDRVIRGVTPVFRGVFNTIYRVGGSGCCERKSGEGGEDLL